MRTLSLELLRHGPSHNQLLSPLTPYLALCENHPAVTLQLPIEHNQMLHRLGALSYRLGEESRGFQLQDTGRMLADLLGKIPGLSADMARPGSAQAGAGPNGGSNGVSNITHLRLVLSASELALLPFELTLSPPGCPGEGQPLLLQGLSPVCITRETRRVAETTVVWPNETRVLLVVAAPASVPAVPALPHLLALRRMLDPWVGDPQQLAQHLTVLTHASLESIAAACAAVAYTHVHILAHGCEFRDGFDARFGLMLHRAGDPGGEADIVSGERLAAALRTPSVGAAPGDLVGPAVVTLASCNSGNVGSVAGVGASIAHALHQAGIPMVIASQFPLSFGGSVRMVEALYNGLLWGEDPRSLMVALRRQLFAQFPDTHDWASLTVYSSLPADFSRQLAAVQIQRAMSSINVALDLADAVVAGLPDSTATVAALFAATTGAAAPVKKAARSRPVGGAPGRAAASRKLAADTASLPALEAALARVREAKKRLEALLGQHEGQRIRIEGLLASTEKREAALSHEHAQRTDPHAEPDTRARFEAEMWAALGRSRKLYFRCYTQGRTPYWTTQYLSLSAVLQGVGRLPADAGTPGRNSAALWNLAEVQALLDLGSAQPQVRTWAQGNLIELYLLAPAIAGLAVRASSWTELAVEQARLLLAGVTEGAFELGSTRRQVARYRDWYGTLGQDSAHPALPPAVLDVVAAVLAVLPETAMADGWDYGKN